MADHKYLTSPPKITTMPPGVPYIVGNEAAERFSYYGMNSILTIFMTKYLLDKMGHLSVMQPANAEAWYHTFVSALYFLPIFGAILADAVFGKFRVVFWLSIVYCLRHLTLALMGSPVAHAIEPRYLLAVGLLMIAMGAGGIEPCVSTNVGDQFGESNKHLLTRVFNWFYFSINAGSALSTLLIPWLLNRTKLLRMASSPKCRHQLSVFLRARACTVRISLLDFPVSSWPSPRSVFGWAAISLFIFRLSAYERMRARFSTKRRAKSCSTF